MGAKKGRIGALPKDWQDRILEAARQREKTYGATYAPALAVLEATGCRPSELAKGVHVSRTATGWTFSIIGTKTGKTGGVAGETERGQVLRTVKVQAVGQWSNVLEIELQKHGGKAFQVKTASGDTIATQMRRICRAEWPDLTAAQLPSPYSYRHRMARDMKTQKEPPEVIAAALGHASCFSQKRYGRWRKGGGSEGPKRIAQASKKPTGGRELVASRSPLAHFKKPVKSLKNGFKGGLGAVAPKVTRRAAP